MYVLGFASSAIRFGRYLAALAGLSLSSAVFAFVPPGGYSRTEGQGFFHYQREAANTHIYGSNGTKGFSGYGHLDLPTGKRVEIPVSFPATQKTSQSAARQLFKKAAGMAGAAGGPMGVAAAWLAAAGVNWAFDNINNEWFEPLISDETSIVWAAAPLNTNFYASKSQACSGVQKWLQEVNGPSRAYRVVSFEDDCKILTVFQSGGSEYLTFGYYSRKNDGTFPVKRIIEEEEFVRELQPWPVPKELVPHLPEALPVGDPVINPKPAPESPSRPLYVPVGNPVVNPNYNPSQAPSLQNPPYYQPSYVITPRPTAINPWALEVLPVNQPLLSPTAPPETTPVPEPTPTPEPTPNPPIVTPDPDNPAQPSEVDGLCSMFPDILACAKFGTPTQGDTLAETTMDVSVVKREFAKAACPAPIEFSAFNRRYEISYETACDKARMIAPIIQLMGFVLAAWIFVSGLKV